MDMLMDAYRMPIGCYECQEQESHCLFCFLCVADIVVLE
jgi:hypothetical protein